MARIRSIKPEFPQSESMGRVSRDARLLFIQIWTICDDAGRARATSRMLASLLYPYDDDAPKLIDGWLRELQDEKCVELYEVGGKHYLEVVKWPNHQKIDRPSQSNIPPFDESSRILANPREQSRSITVGEEGKGEEGKGEDIVGDKSPSTNASQCPHTEIVALYHEVLPELSAVREWTPARQQALRSRWRESEDRQNLQWWREYFEYVKGCDFLMGKTNGRNGAPFGGCNLEWLITPSKMVKVIEGAYENRSSLNGSGAH